MSESRLVHVVSRKLFTSQLHPRRVGSLQKWMFHGDAYRGQRKRLTWSQPFETLESHSQEPLLLVRSGHCFPPIMSPGVELVVTDHLASALAQIASTFIIKPTEIYRLIDFSISFGEACDMEFGGSVALHNFIVDNYPQMVVLNVPQYQEIVLARWPKCRGDKEPCMSGTLRWPPPQAPDDTDEQIAAPVSSVRNEFLYSTGSKLLMSGAVFEVLGPHFHNEFYRHITVMLTHQLRRGTHEAK